MTSVTVTVTRTDLAALNLRTFVGFRRTWLTVLIVLLLVVAVAVYGSGVPSTTRDWFVLVLGGLIGGLAAHCVGLILSLLWVALMSGRAPGVLGTHEYVFTDEGLVERTSANETLMKWGGVRAVRRNPHLLQIEVAPGLFHLIPRRAFANESDYEVFCEQAQRLRSAA